MGGGGVSGVGVHISKEKEDFFFFFEEDKSPVHKEVINICMTEQMTADFHGNALVSPEMSGGDRSRLLCGRRWSRCLPRIAGARTLQSSQRRRDHTGDRHRVNVDLLFFISNCFPRKTHFIHLDLKEVAFSSVCLYEVRGCAIEYV